MCRRCGQCIAACPEHVHEIREGRHILHRSGCRGCGKCVQACPYSEGGFRKSGPLSIAGDVVTPDELFTLVHPQLKLHRFDGGVTVSGGEPLLQHQEVLTFLELCRHHDFHCALETSASLKTEFIEALTDVVDLWLIGLRPLNDSVEGLALTSDLSLVEMNISYLKAHGKKVLIRIPIIPGYTDSLFSMDKISSIMLRHNLEQLQLLPANPYGSHYYEASGVAFSTERKMISDRENLNKIKGFFISKGIAAEIRQG